MLLQKHFNLLKTICFEPDLSQRAYAELLNLSLGNINAIYNFLESAGLVENRLITKEGIKALEPYKVNNAIIMAAGMSTRMAPFSLEKPKGLMLVRGEIIVERIIRQLQEAGIHDITLVLGYMKEKFFYLEEKFDIKIRLNEEYYCCNNTSTLMACTDIISNTYICPSDVYFTTNLFNAYEYQSFYASHFISGSTKEYGLICDKDDRIKQVLFEAENEWCMAGQTYFNKDFAEKFINILKSKYDTPSVQKGYWEDLFAQHTKELTLYRKKIENGIIFEFDSLKDLSLFDPDYIENTDFSVLKNIKKTFSCKKNELSHIEPLEKKNTFSFEYKNERYRYEYPLEKSKAVFKNEHQATLHAKNHDLISSDLFVDENEGWKILKDIPFTSVIIQNKEEIYGCAMYIRKIHSTPTYQNHSINLWDKIEEKIEYISKVNRNNYKEFAVLYKQMKELVKFFSTESYEVFSHGTCKPENLRKFDDKIEFINWSNAGLFDFAFDLGTFISFSNFSDKDREYFIDSYLQENQKQSNKLRRHIYAYTALTSYFWYLDMLQNDDMGDLAGSELYLLYKNIKSTLLLLPSS